MCFLQPTYHIKDYGFKGRCWLYHFFRSNYTTTATGRVPSYVSERIGRSARSRAERQVTGNCRPMPNAPSMSASADQQTVFPESLRTKFEMPIQIVFFKLARALSVFPKSIESSSLARIVVATGHHGHIACRTLTLRGRSVECSPGLFFPVFGFDLSGLFCNSLPGNLLKPFYLKLSLPLDFMLPR